MSIMDRSALEQSSLADLHAIASELGLDGFRRLRKEKLVDAIVARQAGEDPPESPASGEEEEETAAAPRRRAPRERAPRERAPRERAPRASRARRPRREADEEGAERDEPTRPDLEAVEGVVEVLANGSAFVRVSAEGDSDGDVYVSAAQVRRCELVSGDRVGGPVRAARRSERHPSLVRVDTINGAPAESVAAGTRYDDLPAEFPSERFVLGGEDPTLRTIESLTPIGRGSRVTVSGGSRSGKTEALLRLARVLHEQERLEVTVALAGVRPEEISHWRAAGLEPAVVLSFAASPDAQAQAVEQAAERAKRIATRGGDAVLVIDALDGLHPPAARRVLAAARNITGGGSLTVIAAAAKPYGGETTIIALDARLAGIGRFPALDLAASGSLRPELLVGEAHAQEIARTREAAAR
jgi:transcription termination factor Rho